MNEVWTVLANEGPKTAEELPHKPGFKVRQDGVTSFSIRHAHSGSAVSGGGHNQDIYYIENKHDPESVIRKWLEANEKVAAQYSEWTLHQRISAIGDEFKEASYEVFGPFEKQGGPGVTDIEDCPMCEAEITSSLAAHLPCDQ